MKRQSSIQLNPPAPLQTDLYRANAALRFPGREISVRDVWHVLQRRKWAIVVSIVVLTAAAALFTALHPTRYEATARLMLNRENSDTLHLDDLAGPMPATWTDTISTVETQVRILRSDTLAAEAIEKLHLAEQGAFAGKLRAQAGMAGSGPLRKQELVDRFHADLRVQSVPKTQLVEIRFRSTDPKLAADVVNALSVAYVEHHFKTKYDNTMQVSQWLSDQLQSLKEQVESSEQKLVEHQKQSGIIAADDKNTAVIGKIDELTKGLATAQSDRILKEARYRLSASASAELLGAEPDGVLQMLRTQEADLQNQYTQATAKFGSAYPKVSQLREQIAQVRQSIAVHIQKRAETLRNEYQSATDSEQMLRAELAKETQAAYRMNGALVQDAILKREAESERDLYESLQKKLKTAGILASLQASTMDVVDPASVPLRPIEPRVGLNLSIGFVGGLLGGLVLAFLLEHLDDTIRTPEDAEIASALPTVGIIPSLENAPKRKIFTPLPIAFPANSQPATAEAFRALRTVLLAAAESPKVILVTSSLAREGKTTVSLNCAAVLAQAGRRVLVIDADLRRPSVHRALNLPRAPGLGTWLSASGDDAPAVHSIAAIPDLDALTAGESVLFPAELLSSERMRELLRRSRADYDHVIVDAPPVLAFTDGAVLARMCDTVLVVTRASQTRNQSLRRTRDLLSKVNANVAGVVVNDLAMNSSSYYEYYGYKGSDCYRNYYPADDEERGTRA